MQQLRIYFPLFQATQLVGGVSSAYAQEIKKLRKFALSYVTPHLIRSNFKKYPYKISYVFFSSSHYDMVSALTISTFITHLLESNTVIQSTDYRVIPKIEINIKKVRNSADEGLELTLSKD